MTHEQLLKMSSEQIHAYVKTYPAAYGRISSGDTPPSVVPNFYGWRLWWRHAWPWARRREKLALFTAIMCGSPLGEGQLQRVMHERLWRGRMVYGITPDSHMKIGEARVRDLVEGTATSGDKDAPSPNRIAVFADGDTYVYHVA